MARFSSVFPECGENAPKASCVPTRKSPCSSDERRIDAKGPNADERGPKLKLRTPLDATSTPAHEERRVMEAQASWRAAFSSSLRRAMPMPVAPHRRAKPMAIQLHTAHGRYESVATPSVPAM